MNRYVCMAVFMLLNNRDTLPFSSHDLCTEFNTKDPNANTQFYFDD